MTVSWRPLAGLLALGALAACSGSVGQSLVGKRVPDGAIPFAGERPYQSCTLPSARLTVGRYARS